MDDGTIVAGEAIACDAWVVRSPHDGKAYGYRGFDDGKFVVGKARLAFRVGDSIMTSELYWPGREHEAGPVESTGPERAGE